MVSVLSQGFRYFLWVFIAGFGLGILRTLWVVPLVGERWAELGEMPLMLAVIVVVARGRVQAISKNSEAVASQRFYLGLGVVALMFMLGADVAVGVCLRGMTILQALVARDPVSGSVYYGMLLLFGLMPWLWMRGMLRSQAHLHLQ